MLSSDVSALAASAWRRQLSLYLLFLRPSQWGHCSSARFARTASSASSTRWKTRQAGDLFSREAKVQGLKSRAAFKLLQINEKHHIFKKGDTVVDLGYAPGSWTQVAVSRTAPNGRVVGVDVIPVQPPKGASTIQGNFLSPVVQAEVRSFLSDPLRGRPRKRMSFLAENNAGEPAALESEDHDRSYLEMERRAGLMALGSEASKALPAPQQDEQDVPDAPTGSAVPESKKERDERLGRVVDVVLSDMCEPWPLANGFAKKSISDPYYRMMNTSGTPFRDHAGSMDLCNAALTFSFDTLRSGGHFVCKFYQGSEDKLFEQKLKRLFEKVHREKPDASRKESKEGYFVALRRKDLPEKDAVFAE